MANSSAGESVITRAVRVIDAFGPGDSSLGVSEIARRADLPLATAHRIVGELITEGVLDRDRNKQIRMGTRLWEIAQRSSSVLGLREAALPVMEDLQAIVRSHVQLAVISEGEVLYLERLSRRGAVVNVAKIASRIPSYLCSSGLVLLAYAPEEVQQTVAAGDLQRPTERSIGSAAQLRRVLAQVRKQGYSLAPGLLQPTARGVAVPISDSMDRVVAALSIVIPLESDYRRESPPCWPPRGRSPVVWACTTTWAPTSGTSATPIRRIPLNGRFPWGSPQWTRSFTVSTSWTAPAPGTTAWSQTSRRSDDRTAAVAGGHRRTPVMFAFVVPPSARIWPATPSAPLIRPGERVVARLGTMTETHVNLLADGAPVTKLPEDPAVAELASREHFLDVITAHPTSSLCWALLAEGSLNMGSREGDVAAYAYARTGYHRGLDALRRNGWKGSGQVPWEHEPNRGFLKALWALAVAAHRIGETEEYERCAQFLRDSSGTAYDVLAAERPLDQVAGYPADEHDEQFDEVVDEAGERDSDSPMTGPERDDLEAEVALEDEPSDRVLDGAEGDRTSQRRHEHIHERSTGL